MAEGANLSEIVPGMPVYGSDGGPIGPVEAIHESSIRVSHHTIPAATISRVDTGGVHLHLAHATFATAGLGSHATGDGDISGTGPEEQLIVPVAEERLAVGTRQVEIGEASVTKRVVEEQVMVPVKVRREEIEVIRRKPGEPREEIDDPTIVEVIRIPLRGEEPVITTRAVVTSEVVINRSTHTEERQIVETVRSTEVSVDGHLNEDVARLRSAFEDHLPRDRQ